MTNIQVLMDNEERPVYMTTAPRKTEIALELSDWMSDRGIEWSEAHDCYTDGEYFYHCYEGYGEDTNHIKDGIVTGKVER